ncbi:RNA polymerase sigma factor [Zavarzinella formosa]|uniref:RNA polymerase sigma factor n=1 Tax=Zavarzinella formosa TaxID=360055 RepID=UPI0002FD2CC6|nr:sigma-70 family RNA polymerase sigma factor [Zavarzinella formosa]
MEALLLLALRGDSAALNQLFATIRPEIRANCHGIIPPRLRPKADSSDVAQITLQAAFKDFATFRGATISEFRAWLCGIQHNKSLSLIERFGTKSRDATKEVSLAAIQTIPEKTVQEDTLETRELLETGKRLFGELSEPDRTILTLKDEQSLEYGQIAEMLGETEQTLRQRYFRAKNRLLKKIEGVAKDGEAT